jgi:hypothetical protein
VGEATEPGMPLDSPLTALAGRPSQSGAGFAAAAHLQRVVDLLLRAVAQERPGDAQDSQHIAVRKRPQGVWLRKCLQRQFMHRIDMVREVGIEEVEERDPVMQISLQMSYAVKETLSSPWSTASGLARPCCANASAQNAWLARNTSAQIHATELAQMYQLREWNAAETAVRDRAGRM